MPKHEHDCPHCKHLGSLNGVDHYFCPLDKSLIQSDGSDPWQYIAWPLADILRHPDPQKWALTRALLGRAA